jgi:hypothetical protein
MRLSTRWGTVGAVLCIALGQRSSAQFAKPPGTGTGADPDADTRARCERIVIKNPRAIFDALGITVEHMGRPAYDSLRAYVETRVMDGTITNDDKLQLFRILSLRSRVMNPSSRGASQIAAATASMLACYGIDTPGDGRGANDAPDRSAEPLLLAQKYATDHRIALYSYRVDQIGNTNGDFAPILVLADGSTLISGTISDIPPGGKYEIGKSHAIAVKLDPRGKLAWQRTLDKRGFIDYEGGGAAQTADGGFVVFVLSYVHPARHNQTRFVKLSPKGKPVWDSQLPGTGKSSPFPSKTVRLTQAGTIDMVGHIYLADGMHTWTGTLDGKGKLIANTNGDAVPGYGGAGYGGSGYGGH